MHIMFHFMAVSTILYYTNTFWVNIIMDQQNIKWIKSFKIWTFSFIADNTLAKDNAEILHYHIHKKQCTDINYQKPRLRTQCPQNSHIYNLLNLFTLAIIIVRLNKPSLYDAVQRLLFFTIFIIKSIMSPMHEYFHMLFEIIHT